MRDNLNKRVYQSTDDFMEHIELIASNALMYNGADHIITHNANKMKIFVKEQFKVVFTEFLFLATYLEREHRQLNNVDICISICYK